MFGKTLIENIDFYPYWPWTLDALFNVEGM